MTLKWLQQRFGMNIVPVLVLLDDFGGHKGDEIDAAAARMNLNIMYIPSGLTSVAQPPILLGWNPSMQQSYFCGLEK